MPSKKILTGLAIFVIVSMACKLIGEGATQTQPADLNATQNALSTTVAAQATTLAQTTLDAQAAALSLSANATATAAALSAEPTQAAPSANVTQAPSAVATATPAVDSAATQQAQEAIVGIVQQLFDEGIISTRDGEYHRLEDFNESWAQMGYYQWWKTGYSPENFILTADIAWESASDRANWPEAGCGIVFSEDDERDHHLAYLSLDGFGRLAQVARGQWKTLASHRYGNLSVPNGDARIMLVVSDQRINFYVNGQRVVNAYDGSLDAGNLALTLLSGTNKDFGTRCQMSNIDLFILK